MKSLETTRRRLRDTQHLACLACFAFGVGQFIWALTPLIVARGVGRAVPEWNVFATSGVGLLLCAAYIALGSLILRGARWALRATLCMSFLLLAGTVGLSLFRSNGALPFFPTILALGATLTSWLAITTEDAFRRAGQPEITP